MLTFRARGRKLRDAPSRARSGCRDSVPLARRARFVRTLCALRVHDAPGTWCRRDAASLSEAGAFGTALATIRVATSVSGTRLCSWCARSLLQATLPATTQPEDKLSAPYVGGISLDDALRASRPRLRNIQSVLEHCDMIVSADDVLEFWDSFVLTMGAGSPRSDDDLFSREITVRVGPKGLVLLRRRAPSDIGRGLDSGVLAEIQCAVWEGVVQKRNDWLRERQVLAIPIDQMLPMIREPSFFRFCPRSGVWRAESMTSNDFAGKSRSTWETSAASTGRQVLSELFLD